MKISYNWLLDFLPSAYHRSPEELSEILTDTGLEVEGVERIESIPGGLEGIVIGEVLTCVKHENADKLKCTTVDIGGGQISPIVCGAPNVAQGQKVLVATVGATIHPTEGEPFTIKKAKIRGEVSQGMICAEDELSLGESHDGIMVLPEDTVVGTPAAKYFNVTTDYQIEIGLTPNRTDAMGHLGVARDIIAAINCKENTTGALKNLAPKMNLTEGNCPVLVEVKNPDRCPRYAGLVIEDLTIAPSPQWLQDRLKTIGLKPINNVVDITNYVCHGMGHPMHAFDLAKVKGEKVIVQTAATGSKFVSLDETERTLHQDDLMICNASDGMCIAGVFGGMHSGVSENTKAIFLESAYFNPVSVRKTAKRQALNTDASFRYERGIDPSATIEALEHAAALLTEIAGGKVKGGYSDVVSDLPKHQEVVFNIDAFETLVGVKIPTDKIKSILGDLDIELKEENGADWKLQVPAYRADVTRHADVCEEVLRIYGFNEVPIPSKISLSPGKRQNPSKHRLRELLSEFLSAKGISEGMSNGLSNLSYTEQFEAVEKSSIKLLNPLSSDLGILRSHLVFSAIDAVRLNKKFNENRIALFEFGKHYYKRGETFAEHEELSIVLSGQAQSEGWNTNSAPVTWSELKNHVYATLDRLGFGAGLRAKPGNAFWMEYGMEMQYKKKPLVTWGKIKSDFLKKNEVKQEVFFANFHFENLYAGFSQFRSNLMELPKFPGSRRDLSLLLDKQVSYEQLEKEAIKSGTKLLQEVSLFDVYEGKNLPADKKSYALSFQFHAGDRNLTDAEVDAEMQKITTNILGSFNASLR